MARLELDTRKFCPALQREELTKNRPSKAFMAIAKTHRSTTSFTICCVGMNYIDVEVVGDRMVEEIGEVEVRCDGCEHLPKGFSKTVRRKIS